MVRCDPYPSSLTTNNHPCATNHLWPICPPAAISGTDHHTAPVSCLQECIQWLAAWGTPGIPRATGIPLILSMPHLSNRPKHESSMDHETRIIDHSIDRWYPSLTIVSGSSPYLAIIKHPLPSLAIINDYQPESVNHSQSTRMNQPLIISHHWWTNYQS